MISEKQLTANRNNCLKSTGPRSSAGKSIVSQNAIRHGLRSGRIIVKGENSAEYEQFRNDVLDQLVPEGLLELQLADRIAACLWRLHRAGRIEAEIFDYCQDDQVRRLQGAIRAREIAEATLELNGYVPDPPNVVRYESYKASLLAWFKTEDGLAYMEERWPADKGSPAEAFGRFLRLPPDDSPSPVFHEALEEAKVARAIKTGAAVAVNFKPEEPQPQPQPEPEPLGPSVIADMAGKNALMKFSRYETHLERCLYRAMEEFRSLQNVRLRRIVDQESRNEQIVSIINEPSSTPENV